MNSKAPIATRTIDEIKKDFSFCHAASDPDWVLREGDKELGHKDVKRKATPESNAFKALTLFEFDKGILLANSLEECFQTFAIDFLRNLRKEHDCQSPSENALAENATLNFVRTIQVQQKINNIISGSLTQIDIKYFQVLSKELDRANRHFLTSLQALKAIKQPLMQLNIKTQTAIVGQNQLVQSNNE